MANRRTKSPLVKTEDSVSLPRDKHNSLSYKRMPVEQNLLLSGLANATSLITVMDGF